MADIPALTVKAEHFKNIEDEIKRIFDALIFDKLRDALREAPIQNEVGDALYEALQSGQVYYEGGQLKGSFNSKIAKAARRAGATFNKRSKTYSLSSLPDEYKMALGIAQANYKTVKDKVLDKLDTVSLDEINEVSDIPDQYVDTIDTLNKDFEKKVSRISIPPSMTQEQKNIIASEWGFNLDKYIRDWTDENIQKMRSEIQGDVLGGRRASEISQFIEKQYKQSRNKARFLARQETALLVSKFNETRFKDIGSQEYKWSTSGDERVRDDHKALDGQVFSWDSPPVVDRTTGNRAHPGEDFNCRCVPIAIIE